MNATDTNILAYSVDADSPEKRSKAIALLQSLHPHETIVPWQVICELGAVLTKFSARGQVADPTVIISAIAARYKVMPPPEELVLHGLKLRAMHQLSYWDALLIAGCIDAGATRLYTEDLQGKPVIERIELVNPFA